MVYQPKETNNIFLDYILAFQKKIQLQDHLLPGYFLGLFLGLHS